MTQEQLFSDEVIEELFALSGSDRIHRKQELLQAARQLGCKGNFEQYIKEFEKDEKAQIKQGKVININSTVKSNAEGGNLTNFTYLTEMGKEQFVCSDYVANDEGIFKWQGRILEKIAEAPIFPMKQYYNPIRDTYKITLIYKKDGEWKEGTWDASDIYDSSKLVRLSGNGLPVVSNNAKKVSAYIQHIMTQNDFTPILCTEKLGWQDDEFKSFAPYTSTHKLDVALKQEIKDTLEPKGDYKAWVRNMVQHRRQGRNELNVLLAASFASPLLKMCSALPFWVHLHGFTGVGKTICLMASASIWGNPDTSASLVSGFRSTTVGIETRANMLNTIPAFMDDTAEVQQFYGGNLGDLVYMMCKGQGKVRGNKDLTLRDSKTWNLVTISTGETAITTEKSRGGEANRIIEIATGNGEIFTDGAEEADFLRSNYGYAGREFIRIITEELCPEIIREEYRIIRERLKKKMADEGRKILGKQLNSFCMLLLADKIATEHIFCDGNYLNEDKFLSDLKNTDDIDNMLIAYKSISDTLLSVRNKHFKDYSNEVWGRMNKETGGMRTQVHILPTYFNSLCRQKNVDPKDMKNYLFDKGVLEGTKDKRQPGGYRKDKLETFGETKARFVVFYLFYEPDVEE